MDNKHEVETTCRAAPGARVCRYPITNSYLPVHDWQIHIFLTMSGIWYTQKFLKLFWGDCSCVSLKCHETNHANGCVITTSFTIPLIWVLPHEHYFGINSQKIHRDCYNKTVLLKDCNNVDVLSLKGKGTYCFNSFAFNSTILHLSSWSHS